MLYPLLGAINVLAKDSSWAWKKGNDFVRRSMGLVNVIEYTVTTVRVCVCSRRMNEREGA